jgi:ADP-ribosylation factor GTPase-activating protein 1
MDAFKNSEILRMENGGNDPWKKFFDAYEINKMEGRTFEGSTVTERYSGEVGEEWKERLSAKVEGREFVKGERRASTASMGSKPVSRSQTPRSQTPLGQQRTQSPAKAIGTQAGRKEKNEAYFARLGNENASRPEDLPPNQGGKFSGFGSEPLPTKSEGGPGMPGIDDFQKDPMAALTKGFGWFTTTVGKGAKTVNDSYIQPAAKTVCPKPPGTIYLTFHIRKNTARKAFLRNSRC